MAGRARALAAALLALAGLSAAGEALAQAAPSRFTYGTRYDASDKVVGTIAPDADGVAPFSYGAVRNTYDAAGRLIRVEKGWLTSWQSESVAPANWGAAFQVRQKVETNYDGQDRMLVQWNKGWDTVTSSWNDVGLTQYSYDVAGRLECTAVRMNPAIYGSLPANACTMGAAGTGPNDFGPDRITKSVYDAAGQVLQVREGVGSSAESAEATYSYTPNGKKAQVIDANGNRAELRYDGFDRQVKWVFPADARPVAYNDATPASAVASAGSLNEADYEEYGYDADGLRETLRKRDGSVLGYSYDKLHRITRKSVPARSAQAAVSGQPSSGNTPALGYTHTRDVFYSYDLRGLQSQAMFEDVNNGGMPTEEGLSTLHDGFGLALVATQLLDGTSRTLASCYDRNGNRIRTSFAESSLGTYVAATGYCANSWTQFVTYSYDDMDRPTAILRDGSAGIASYTYRASGERITFNGGFATSYDHDPAGRVNALTNSLPALGGSNAWTFSYNPASQIVQSVRTNDAFAWSGHYNVDRNYATNGLNQYTAAAAAVFCYDRNGNLIADSGNLYVYDVENRLVERRVRGPESTTCGNLDYASQNATLLATLRYDPSGRLYEVAAGSGATRYFNDGDALVAEYSNTNALLRRYVHGTDGKTDDPIAWYEGASYSAVNERFMRSDWQGSVVAVADSPGTTLIAINRYDEYGVPHGTNQGRFQYTGQAWIGELGMYYYKARIYSPTLGRFMQTDPIGYEDQVNLYAYVGGDPVGRSDPSGLFSNCAEDPTCGYLKGGPDKKNSQNQFLISEPNRPDDKGVVDSDVHFRPKEFNPKYAGAYIREFEKLIKKWVEKMGMEASFSLHRIGSRTFFSIDIQTKKIDGAQGVDVYNYSGYEMYYTAHGHTTCANCYGRYREVIGPEGPSPKDRESQEALRKIYPDVRFFVLQRRYDGRALVWRSQPY